MRRYLEVIRSPHLGAMFAASLLARLPIGINGLAIVLLIYRNRRSVDLDDVSEMKG